MVSTVYLIAALVAPLTVLACEDECMTGITNEYLHLYSTTVNKVLHNMAVKLDTQIVSPDSRRLDPVSYFIPVLDAFNETAYDELQDAIFPSYFHGKCLDANGAVPDGCPNPDCPVVCGTPGSMVHFYSKLKHIVYDQVSRQLTYLTSPGSKTYQKVKKAVLADAQRKRRRRGWPAPSPKYETSDEYGTFEKRAATMDEKRFRAIMKSFPKTMLTACGGRNLGKCSWEKHMKKFILQYP